MDRMKQSALIFGRSFGLYGHAMALDKLGVDIFVPSHYRDFIFDREEYVSLQKNACYIDNPLSDINSYSIICCARRPYDNEILVNALLEKGYKGSVIVEKPMGISPDIAHQIAVSLSQAQLRWDVPYLFLHLEWFEHIKHCRGPRDKVSIFWSHNGQFEGNNWKVNDNQGGGILAFYLIHVLALFEKLDLPSQVKRLQDGTWKVSGNWLDVEFKISDDALFSITKDEQVIFHDESPFGAMPTKGTEDTRIPALKKFYQAFFATKDQGDTVAFHQRILERWRDGCL